MEFKKVGNELHLLDENNIPLYIIGEGFIKRLCEVFRPYYRNYYKVPFIPKFQNFLVVGDEALTYFEDMFGEQNGKLLFEICSNESIFFRSFIGTDRVYCFPEGRNFNLCTSDFVAHHHKNLNIIEEDITVESIDNMVHLDKYPLVYDVFSLQQQHSVIENPILSNETVDIYYEGNAIKFGVKKFPLDLDKLTSISGINISLSEIERCYFKCDLIRRINRKSLEEQSLALSDGFKTLRNAILHCAEIPGTEVVVRWSKYLHLTPHLRRILKKSKKKTAACPFLRRYLECDVESRKQLMSIGDTLIANVVSFSTLNRNKIFNYHIYDKSEIQLIVELDKRYGENYSIDVYKRYNNLRKSLGKKTPAFPETWNELFNLYIEFEEEEQELAYSGINITPKAELEFEDEKIIATYPRAGVELYREGKNLHHCVGGYVDGVAEGKTNILFLRRKDDPEKAFYTMQVDNEYAVVQVRGLQNNINYPEDLQKFLKKYKKYLKEKSK